MGPSDPSGALQKTGAFASHEAFSAKNRELLGQALFTGITSTLEIVIAAVQTCLSSVGGEIGMDFDFYTRNSELRKH